MAEIRFNYGGKFTQTTDTNTGIGSTIPAGKLDVAGNTKAGSLRVSGIATLSSVSGFVNTKLTTNTEDYIVESGQSGSVSGEVVVSTGQTVSVSTGATTGQGGVQSLKVYQTFMPPVGGIEDRPTDVKPGMVYYNKDFKTIEFWDGNFWKQVGNTTRSTRAIICGGSSTPAEYTSDIDAVNISTKGNAIRFGQMQNVNYAPGAFASETRGIIFGGRGGSSPYPNLDVIDYVALASEGNGVDFGNLTATQVHTQGCSSSTRGVQMGGFQDSNVMAYVQIATTGNALDFGDLVQGRHTATCVSTPIHGFVAAGNTPSNDSSIEKITFSTTGNATSFGDLSEIRGSTPAGASNSTTGIFALGRTISSVLLNTIETMNMSTQGSAKSFGDISQPGTQVSGATSSPSRVIVMGGMMAPNNTKTNAIHSITISSSGGAEDFGDLTRVKTYHYSTSDSHGGLGGF